MRLILMVVLTLAGIGRAAAQNPEPFAAEIRALIAAEKTNPPKPCSVVFVGSSSIRLWKTLADDLAPLDVVNRGFGGATIADVNYYFDQLIAPLKPRAIVFYAGENDLANGASPSEVADAFQRFMALKDATLDSARVYFISLKPSKLRFAQMGMQAQVNAAIQQLSLARKDLIYVDIVPGMLLNGKPRNVFTSDGLHMTAHGYAIWTSVLRPALANELMRPATCR